MALDKKRVLVTGSTGNLGAKAVAALRSREDLDVVCIGRNGAGDPSVITADLERYDAAWAGYFQNADAVLHLAADPKPVGTWDSIVALNVRLAFNVFRAAEEGRVRRFVFASSNWTLGGYRFSDARLTPDLTPWPVNPYGMSKLFMEEYGKSLAVRTGMSVIALRIGYCQPGDNIPGPHMAFGLWGQQMWLGNKDWAQAVIKSVTSPYEGAAVVNVMSRNQGMRWDLDAGRRTIGYDPEETHTPTLAPGGRVKDVLARLRETLAPRGVPSPVFGARW